MRVATEGNIMKVREEFTSAKINLMRSGAEQHQGVDLWKLASEVNTIVGRKEGAYEAYKTSSSAARNLAEYLLAAA